MFKHLALVLVLAAPSLLNAAPVTIFECKTASGVTYQQVPCPEAAKTVARTYNGDSAQNAAAAQRLAEELQAALQADAAEQARNQPRIEPPRKTAQSKPICPPTRENPGTPSVIYDDPARAYEQYRALPSETYLRNAGRWPEGC